MLRPDVVVDDEESQHGPTSAGNLGLLSRRCHSAKHDGWTLLRHDDGSVRWRSPLHRHYDRPGPWAPPPQVDLHSDLPPVPPPLRPPPGPLPPGEPDAGTLLDRLRAPEPEPQARSSSGWPDDPPF